jgi:aspartyl-tRNA(Asn)/glutamyl-tRNA(Gln) amidotransferase subunit A
VPTPWAFEADDAWLALALAEFGRAHAALLERLEELDPAIQITLQAGAAVSAEDERAARDRATAGRNGFAATMADVQMLVTPTTPFAAPRHDETTIMVAGVEQNVQLGAQSHFTRPISSIGAPAVSVPCGATSSGLPIGMQLVGRMGAELLLLRAAARYQNETGWHRRVPSLAA